MLANTDITTIYRKTGVPENQIPDTPETFLQSIWSTFRQPEKFQISRSIEFNLNMVFKAPEWGDFGFFTEFRITLLAIILRKFLKTRHIKMFYSCYL